MSRKFRGIQLPLYGKVFLALLALVYLVYLGALVKSWYNPASVSAGNVIEHPVNTSANTVINYWTAASMSNAVTADEQDGNAADFSQASIDTSQARTGQQDGQPPANGDTNYPLSTVGKIFFSNASGQNMVCSGTAVESQNHSVVDTAGHCLYWQRNWVQNFIFCPLYLNGDSPYGCWAARDLEVPNDWINAKPNDFHHDLGMAIVASNSQGLLTDLVGGAGWTYNHPINQPFFAYGYPAAYPFDGQTRQKCENVSGTASKHGAGNVVSIPCDMTGGSSGGPWFIKINGNYYLTGHNDFISSVKPNHMFSPIYDDTWYALYDKAQHT